jgi:hypothetical protein
MYIQPPFHAVSSRVLDMPLNSDVLDIYTYILQVHTLIYLTITVCVHYTQHCTQQIPIILLHLVGGLLGYFVPRAMGFSEVNSTPYTLSLPSHCNT